MRGLLLLVAMCSVSVHRVYGYGWWIHQPYEDTDEYNAKAEYLSNATLTCLDKTPDQGYTFMYWILPDMTIANTGFHRSFKTLDGPAGWHVDTNGQMVAYNVQEEHFGFYTCIAEKDAVHHAVKRSLNVKGPYFGDLWQIYRMPTIIGLSAAGGVLILSVGLCLLYNHKVYGPKNRKEDAEKAKSLAAENDKEVKFTSNGGEQVRQGRINDALVEDGANTLATSF